MKLTNPRPSGVAHASFLFPYPPSVNHCWGRKGKAVFLSSKYKDFLNDVALVVAGTRLREAPGYYINLVVAPPDRRARDLDNVLKPILDSLTRCCVWTDDSLVARIHVDRSEPKKGGEVAVMVGVLTDKQVQAIRAEVRERRLAEFFEKYVEILRHGSVYEFAELADEYVDLFGSD